LSVNTPCVRCGKLRVEAKSWTEKVSGSVIFYTQTVCPDSECQKIVEEEWQKKVDKVKAIQAKSIERRKIIKRKKKS